LLVFRFPFLVFRFFAHIFVFSFSLTRHADHVTPSIRKMLALTSLTSGRCSVGIVRLRTEAMEFFFLSIFP
jgi:hypothetical protein